MEPKKYAAHIQIFYSLSSIGSNCKLISPLALGFLKIFAVAAFLFRHVQVIIGCCLK